MDQIKDDRFVKQEKLPIKTYEPRNSIITNLINENEHIRVIHYLCGAICLGTILFTALDDYNNEERVFTGFQTIYHAFKKFPYALYIWVFLLLSSIVVYYGFLVWARVRLHLEKLKKPWDTLWLMILLLYYSSLPIIAAKAVLAHELGIASSLSVLMEVVRLLMKTHAFVRTNCPKYLQKKKEFLDPTFSHFLYFSFAPVLVYKDSYPRSNQPIRWNFIGNYFLQFVLGIIFFSIVFEKSIIAQFKDYGVKSYTWGSVVVITLRNFHSGLLLGLMFVYLIHVYLNMTSESLRFSDRLFFEDWWTTTRFGEYFRRWNIFIHDWLYVYVYKDIYEHVFRYNKTMARFMVFLISGIAHDFIICVAGRLFIPITLIMFSIPAGIFHLPVSKRKQVFGVTMWIKYGVNVSVMFTILSIEYYARQNCPQNDASIYQYIKPRFLYC